MWWIRSSSNWMTISYKKIFQCLIPIDICLVGIRMFLFIMLNI
jgi:hypothetical protein